MVSVWLRIKLRVFRIKVRFFQEVFFPRRVLFAAGIFFPGEVLPSLTGSNLVDNPCQMPSLLLELIQCMLIK